MNKIFIHFFCLLLGFSLFVNRFALAVDLEFEAIKKTYFTLKNIDPQYSQQEKWKATAGRIRNWLNRNSSNQQAPEALFYIVSMDCNKASMQATENLLDICARGVQEQINKYPKSSLTDDLLMKLADIYQEQNQNQSAVSLYEKIVQDYSSTDMADVARVKIMQIESRGSLNQGYQEEVPDNSPKKLGIKRIVLDPGHGGEDFGALGISGILEKDVTLDVSLQLKDILESQGNYEVYLTRTADQFVPLTERTNFANELNADLFLSIHSNASLTRQNFGYEIYYLDTSTDTNSKKLADRENASVDFEGSQKDVYLMLADLMQSSKMEDSVKLAHHLDDHIGESLKKENWNNIRSNGVRRAPFYVLLGAHMPCVLLELFFIDHPRDGEMLSQKQFRAALAKTLASGVTKFLDAK